MDYCLDYGFVDLKGVVANFAMLMKYLSATGRRTHCRTSGKRSRM